jgi:hypothetical protein
MARGDHIRVHRGVYWHHGIDCGDGTVIHYSGTLKNKRRARIERVTVNQFAHPGDAETIEVVAYDDSYPPEEVICRAESRLGEAKYSFLRRNCEHFAHWCKTGKSKSRQVIVAARAVGASVVALGAFGLAVLATRKSRPKPI